MESEVRSAVAEDVAELVRLRAVMLSSLGRDPGPVDAPWRETAADWFRERLERPQEWAFRVVPAGGGILLGCGAAWLNEHLPGPRAPFGYRGYIGFMVTRPQVRGRGHGRAILRDLVGWLAQREVSRIELRASAAGYGLYRSEGFVEEDAVAMVRDLGPSVGGG